MIVCYVLANLGYYAVLRTDQIVDWEQHKMQRGCVTVLARRTRVRPPLHPLQ